MYLNASTLLIHACQDPEDTRSTTILQLEILAGVAKGLTRTVDGITVLEDETDPSYQAESEKVRMGREDKRTVVLRNNIFSSVRGVVELWSADAAIGQVCGFLFSIPLLSEYFRH